MLKSYCMKNLFLFFLISTTCLSQEQQPASTAKNTEAPGAVIDKIALVINDQTFSLSDFNNVKKNYASRSEVASVVYPQDKNSLEDLAFTFQKSYIIRYKLKEMGYSITDDVVEERIKFIEKAQGLSRNDLNAFLKTKSLTYEMYFDLIKESIEVTQYLQKVIYPTIDVSDQEIKNFFIKNYPSFNQKSVKYDLIAITLPKDVEKNYSLKDIISHLRAFKDGISLPEGLSKIESYKMDKIDDSNLDKNISSVLKKTDIGEFTEVVKVQNKNTLFFVENKEFSSSNAFESEKEKIKMQLAFEKARGVLDDWIKSELKNHYISLSL